MAENDSNSDESVLDLSSPSRIDSLNLDRLTEDQVLAIPRKRAYLSRLRVRELRKITRDECGSGTWITHASKEEPIEGTLQGRPPLSAQAVDRKGEAPAGPDADSEASERPVNSALSEEYAQPMAQSMLDLVSRVSRRVVESEMKQIRSELNEIREEVGMDPVGREDPKDQITEVLKEEAQKSEDTARKLSEEIAKEDNGRS